MAKSDEEATCDAIISLFNAVHNAFEKPDLLPALLMLYVSIDVIASLTRPVGQMDTSGEIFMGWVDEFMLAGQNLPCNSKDIWAARCGFLHTMSVESKLSRHGHARHLEYVDRRELVPQIQATLDRRDAGHVVVSLPAFVEAFLGGAKRFIERLPRDADLRTRVFHHSRKLVQQAEFPYPKS